MELKRSRKFRNRKKWVSVAMGATLSMSACLMWNNVNVRADVEKAVPTVQAESSSKIELKNNTLSDHVQTNKSQKKLDLPSSKDYQKVIAIHRYSEPTGRYENGSFKDMQLIQDKDSKFGVATQYNSERSDGGKYQSYSTMGVGNYNGKNYYNIWGGDENVTVSDGNIVSIPTSTDSGYKYDSVFQQKADPDHYYDVMEHNGQANINISKVPRSSSYNNPQAYHFYYKKADQKTYKLQSSTDHAYQAVLNWFDYDNGFYLGSTTMNDYSMGLGGFLQDKDWPTQSLKNNTDYEVIAPKNYRFTDDDPNEFGYDTDTKHPFVDITNSADRLHKGVFHQNEWANWGQYDSRGNQVHSHQNGNNIHCFRLYVKYEGKASEYKMPTQDDIKNGVYAQPAVPTSYTQIAHTADPNYRQLLLRVIDFDTWQSLNQVEIPINISNSTTQNIDLSKVIPAGYNVIDVSLTSHVNIDQEAKSDTKSNLDGTPYEGINKDGFLHVGVNFNEPYLTNNYFSGQLTNNGMSTGYREVYVRKSQQSTINNEILKIKVVTEAKKQSGFVSKDGKWYYFDENGHALTDGLYKLSDGYYHYFNSDGTEAINEIKPANGTYYYFDQDGHAYNKGLVKASDGYLHYYGKDYRPAVNQFVAVDGKWYYFDQNGHALTDGLYKLSDGYYHYYNADGTEVINNWKNGKYFDQSGHMC